MLDQGGGLPADMERLFQSFYTTKPQGWAWAWPSAGRSSPPTTAGFGRSLSPVRGSVFHFELPVAGFAQHPMNPSQGIVYLLDDEPQMVKALTRLLRAKQFDVRGFTSVREFLAAFRADERACLVLDVAMPELDGLELQQRLTHHGILIPIVFLTGQGDIPMSVRAIKAGAVDFLTKPVDAAILIQAVRAALRAAATRQQEIGETAALAARLASLTLREREVMEHVVAGQLNKQIAADLGTGEQNIKLHRAHIMKKMAANRSRIWFARPRNSALAHRGLLNLSLVATPPRSGYNSDNACGKTAGCCVR